MLLYISITKKDYCQHSLAVHNPLAVLGEDVMSLCNE